MSPSDDESSGTTDTSQGIDFERADFGETPDGSAAASLSCSICGVPIGDTYFTNDGAFVCARCEGPAREAGPPGSRFGRLLGALSAGTLAAVVASALWMAVTALTGYEIGLIAIAVGWIVGVAIQIGNRGVGGLPYQLLALFLTYSAIVMTYVPQVAAELESEWASPSSELSEDSETDFILRRGVDTGTEPDAPPADAEEVEAVEVDETSLSPEETKFAAWILAIPISYAVPFLAGFENAIGILIIGFALYQAWKMTAKKSAEWAGPFQVGSEATE